MSESESFGVKIKLGMDIGETIESLNKKPKCMNDVPTPMRGEVKPNEVDQNLERNRSDQNTQNLTENQLFAVDNKLESARKIVEMEIASIKNTGSVISPVKIDVAWQRFVDGGEKRLDGHSGTVLALAECMGRVCSGGKDDVIRVWNKTTLELEKTLDMENGAAVWSMTAWQDQLISGHDDGKVRVWDLTSGECDQVLEGHEDGVNALAVCGDRLASGSDDCNIRIWGMGGTAWPCERTLEGHRGLVSCLTVWEGFVISGSWDDTIRVWDAATGEHRATLAGHRDTVMALLVHGRRLLSASVDGSIRVWSLGGDWALLRTLEVYCPGAGQWVRCLAACRAGLVAGSFGPEDPGRRHEVRVWDPETLECRATVPQPAGQRVLALLGMEGGDGGEGGEVWAGVGDRWVVVWGRG